MNKSYKSFTSAADKLGSAGACVLGLFCPACIPAIGAFLSAIGLGFLVNTKVLLILMIALIIFTITSFTFSYLKEHKNPLPLLLALAGAIGIYGGKYIFPSLLLLYGGVASFISASMLNWYLRRKMPQSRSCCVVKSVASRP